MEPQDDQVVEEQAKIDAVRTDEIIENPVITEDFSVPTRRKAPQKNKLARGPIIVMALVTLLGCGFFGYQQLFNSIGAANQTDTNFQEIEIKKGASTKSIANTLAEAGIIKSTTSFEHYVKTHNFDGKLRNGTYLLSANMPVPELVDQLLNGIGDVAKFTIPEGYTLSDIAQVLVKQEIMSEDDFWAVVTDGDFSAYDFLSDKPHDRHRLEGFLFPDTYIIAHDSAPIDVIKTLLDRFVAVKNTLPENKSGLSLDQLVTLASLIESEARVDADRPLIASVYLNRITANMPLQCDATIQYALPEHKERLFYTDYKYQSPYNTYLFQGFPPTAICSPGEKSLIAAAQPAETRYLYYLWNKESNGGHVFAESYDEHLKNRTQYGYD